MNNEPRTSYPTFADAVHAQRVRIGDAPWPVCDWTEACEQPAVTTVPGLFAGVVVRVCDRHAHEAR